MRQASTRIVWPALTTLDKLLAVRRLIGMITALLKCECTPCCTQVKRHEATLLAPQPLPPWVAALAGVARYLTNVSHIPCDVIQ
jgi:hypothetical protein